MTESIIIEWEERERGTIVVLTMNEGENRWNTSFTRAFEAALDDVEATEGPAVLVTRSADQKFFSNGLDLEWMTSRGDHPGGDRRAFANEAMALFGRLITLPMPTVCSVNGHGFGAGFMIALCHDMRIMRSDRGFLCANELELGFAIPEPELALFRHKLSADAFHQSTVLAKRWAGAEALQAGVVQSLATADELGPATMETAEGLLRVARNREVTGWTKTRLYGENAALDGPHGPAYMLANPDLYGHGPGKVPSTH